MDYKVLYRKYRPTSFDQLIGQNNVKDILINSIINDKLSHAYIFTGPRGTGKTSTAKLFAKVLNCHNPEDGIACGKCESCLNYENSVNIIEMDAASNNGVDEIRLLRENVKVVPSMAKYKIYIVDEVHMLSSSAWNAFLKTLEEPPKHVIFILATTELNKIPVTVLSRCQRFQFNLLSYEDIYNNLIKIADNESIKYDEDAMKEIAYLSEGSVRDSLSILDQISKTNEKITLNYLSSKLGVVSEDDINKLLDYVFDKDKQSFINYFNEVSQNIYNNDIFLNKVLEKLLDRVASSNNVNEEIFNLIDDIESCFLKSRTKLMIKTYFLKFISNSVKEPNIISQTTDKEQKVEKTVENDTNNVINDKKTAENISREIFSEQKLVNKIKIRINNSFHTASKTEKNKYIKLWKEYLNHLEEISNLKLYSILNEANIEVVSKTNVLLSSGNKSNSTLINSVADEISHEINKLYEVDLKIICLTLEEWQKEKDIYIKNKEKIYEYMDEPKIDEKDESVLKAKEIFDNIVVKIS